MKIVSGRFSRTRGTKKELPTKEKISLPRHYQDIYVRGQEAGFFGPDKVAAKLQIDFVFHCFMEIVKMPTEYEYLKDGIKFES